MKNKSFVLYTHTPCTQLHHYNVIIINSTTLRLLIVYIPPPPPRANKFRLSYIDCRHMCNDFTLERNIQVTRTIHIDSCVFGVVFAPYWASLHLLVAHWTDSSIRMRNITPSPHPADDRFKHEGNSSHPGRTVRESDRV